MALDATTSVTAQDLSERLARHLNRDDIPAVSVLYKEDAILLPPGERPSRGDPRLRSSGESLQT